MKWDAVYSTAKYGRNTVHTKRLFHGPYTVVIITYTDVRVRGNGGKPSFTITVTLLLGGHEIFITSYKEKEENYVAATTSKLPIE